MLTFKKDHIKSIDHHYQQELIQLTKRFEKCVVESFTQIISSYEYDFYKNKIIINYMKHGTLYETLYYMHDEDGDILFFVFDDTVEDCRVNKNEYHSILDLADNRFCRRYFLQSMFVSFGVRRFWEDIFQLKDFSQDLYTIMPYTKGFKQIKRTEPQRLMKYFPINLKELKDLAILENI